jgi:hypothetical protein
MATFSLDQAIGGVSNVAATLSGANPVSQQQLASLEANNYLASYLPSADGNGLPFTSITPGVNAQISRNIITWFVPQFGTVRMFINPQNISYAYKKLITKERTKGGYTLQYWGEDLTTLNISGVTGSAGVEGINALYEIYRAEQYAFDAVGLTLAANNAYADVGNNLNNGLGGDQLSSVGLSPFAPVSTNSTGILGGVLGLDSPNNVLSARNIPSLASLAFAVEMYYGGWVFRGFFESMTVNERADNFLLDYNMVFTVTQRRGYRTNYFPWSQSPVSGPSAYNTPPSFSGFTSLGTTNGAQVSNSSQASLDAANLLNLL